MKLSPVGELVVIWLPLLLIGGTLAYAALWSLYYKITGKDPWAVTDDPDVTE